MAAIETNKTGGPFLANNSKTGTDLVTAQDLLDRAAFLKEKVIGKATLHSSDVIKHCSALPEELLKQLAEV